MHHASQHHSTTRHTTTAPQRHTSHHTSNTHTPPTPTHHHPPHTSTPRSITYDLFNAADEQHENIALAAAVEGVDFVLLDEVVGGTGCCCGGGGVHARGAAGRAGGRARWLVACRAAGAAVLGWAAVLEAAVWLGLSGAGCCRRAGWLPASRASRRMSPAAAPSAAGCTGWGCRGRERGAAPGSAHRPSRSPPMPCTRCADQPAQLLPV